MVRARAWAASLARGTASGGPYGLPRVGRRGTLRPPPPKPASQPSRQGAIRLARIAPHSGDLMASPAQAIVGYYVLPQQTLKPAILARMAFHGRYGAIRREKIAPVGLSGSSSISGAGAGAGDFTGTVISVVVVPTGAVIPAAVAAAAGGASGRCRRPPHRCRR
ncbi:hypothetical protein TIFTF001_056509, partial [Ficus carica]